MHDSAQMCALCMTLPTVHCNACVLALTLTSVHTLHTVNSVHSGLIFTSRGPATSSPTQWADFLGQEIKNKRRDEIIAMNKAMTQS